MEDEVPSIHLEKPDLRERAGLVHQGRGVLAGRLNVQPELGTQSPNQLRGDLGVRLALNHEAGGIPVPDQKREIRVRSNQIVPAAATERRDK